ncbi:unnamed protein product, partial [Chrysoparadoxa australica]
HTLRFQLSGDPRLMLRTINPEETDLFDKAAGVHVRFRLGGHTFPPTIYYKVYTHNPVSDVGAFAPRYYCIGEQSGSDAPPKGTDRDREQSIRVGSSYFETKLRDGCPNGWYERQDCNGWRPITIKTLALGDDAVAKDTSR